MSVRDEVLERLHRLAFLADNATDDELDGEYRQAYTADAVWEMADPAGGDPDRRTGIEAIMAGVRQRRTDGRNGPGTGVRHLLTTSIVRTVDATTCVASSYFMVTSGGRGATVTSVGQYRDTFVLVDGTWLLTDRRISV